MRTFPGHQALPPGALNNPVVAIGNFDGVHRGHQQLLLRVSDRARALGGDAVVLTFDPHPAKLLAPALAPPLLTTLPRKLELLEARGMAATVVEPFTPALAALTPEDFISRVLAGGLGAREIVVGYDFTYGRKRAGTVDTLRAAGAFDAVHIIPAVGIDGIVCSSTKIREFILEGNVAGARLLLGRDFDADGVVVRGAGRGRQIGVPTANLRVTAELLPRPGIYAGTLTVDDEPLPAAISLGTNPTFGEGGTLSLEAHILDFSGDLYGRTLRVAFRARLRAEEKYDSVDLLLAQIKKDIDNTRDVFRTG